jgi:hypothetical protein
MKENFGAETSTENTAAVDLIISLERTPRMKVIRMNGQSHFNEWGKY